VVAQLFGTGPGVTQKQTQQTQTQQTQTRLFANPT
jgi:hypothetical protein